MKTSYVLQEVKNIAFKSITEEGLILYVHDAELGHWKVAVGVKKLAGPVGEGLIAGFRVITPLLLDTGEKHLIICR